MRRGEAPGGLLQVWQSTSINFTAFVSVVELKHKALCVGDFLTLSSDCASPFAVIYFSD